MSNLVLLQLNATANWGSTGKIAEGIGLAAMERGWESYIAYGRSLNPSKSQLIPVGSKKDVYLHYFRNRFFDEEGLGSKGPTKELIKKIENNCPDIIQLHNIHDHWLNYPLLFEYLSTIDTPIVWTFHDCWAFTGGCAHFDNCGCLKWLKDNCKSNCPKGHNKSNRNFQLRQFHFSKIGTRLNIVAVSNWLGNFVNDSMFKKMGASINVINNGIDTSIFKISECKQPIVLGVSNIWNESKGLFDFFKLRAFLPDDIQIILVGLKSSQIKELPKGIIGIERTQNIGELSNLYSKASVFVNPTYNDSFPTVNLEALACGTPVITYQTGGSPEAIDDKTGLVVKKGDVEALANAVLTVINNPDKYSPENCRNRAELNFNKDIQFKKYIDLYESLIL